MQILAAIKDFFYTFIVFNANAITFIFYYLKTHILLLLVLLAMGYLIYQELVIKAEEYVDDERPIL